MDLQPFWFNLSGSMKSAQEECAGPAGIGSKDPLEEYLANCGYCLVCEKVRPSIRAHKSTTKRKGRAHDYRRLTAEEREEAKTAWQERAAGGKAVVQEQTKEELHKLQSKHPPAQEPAVPREQGPYRMEFGKYKGKTLDDVREAINRKHGRQKGPQEFLQYLQVLVSMGWHDRKPGFQHAMEEAGVWDTVAKNAPATQKALAERAIEKYEKGKGDQGEHPQVQLLRQLQADQAVAVLDTLGEVVAVDEEDVPEAPPADSRSKKRRKTRSRVVVEIHQCLYCGATDHNQRQCPNKPEAHRMPNKRAVQIAHVQNKRIAKLVSRIKYTMVRQRSKQYDARARQLSRVRMRTSWLRLARAQPKTMSWMCIQDGLLCDLSGCPCPNPKCGESKQQGFSGEAKLGRLVVGSASRSSHSQDVSASSVFYRCGLCRARVRVNHGSRLYGSVGGGNKGVSYMTLTFWNCAVGISLSHTCQQLDLNEGTVGAWYQTARRIMAADALERQAQIRFGQQGPMTVVIEADETQIFHWSEMVTEGGMTFRRHWWYVWLGVVARGDLSTLYLTPVGLTKSDGDKGAVPPLSPAVWARVCDELFDSNTNAILCTDTAGAYVNYDPPSGAFVQKFQVNHTEHEYTRSVEMVTDIERKTTEVHLAGTQTLDHEWSLLKDELPRNTTAKTDEGRAVMDEYWRAAQWRRMVNTDDKWTAFCKAAQKHGQQKIGQHLLMPQFHELEDAEEKEPNKLLAPQNLKEDAADSLINMVAQLSAGELKRLEEAIASRRASAEDKGVPPQSTDVEVQPALEDAPLQAVADPCPLCTPAFTCGVCAGRSGCVSADYSPLGDAAPMVPAAVHKEMEALYGRGELPRTSLEERLRNKPTSGSGYGVPPALRDAFRHGYIHPNLSPPLGMRWKARAGVWHLLPVGG